MLLRITPYYTSGVFNHYPFFPYNYFFTRPSYRADETGQIRMIYTHNKLERCPPEAPVVRIVSEDEIQLAMKEIQIKEMQQSL